MNKCDKLFLEAFRASLENRKVEWDFEITPDEWVLLFRKAEIHQVLPLIFEAVFACPAAQVMGKNFFMPYRRKMMQQVMLQIRKTEEFMNLYRFLHAKGLHPLMVKGITCRQLYPNPDYRSSGDEDMLIKPREFKEAHKTMLEYGMVTEVEDRNLKAQYEIPYVKTDAPLYIELHKSLFPPESEAYGELNNFFKDVHVKAIAINVQGMDILTMEYTENLFYLICHAFKHFLHSGFGIRQVSDMIMFANAYGKYIDWDRVLKNCEAIHADKFAMALFMIGERYLGFSFEKACCTDSWKKADVDAKPLLNDLLAGGIYGDSDMSRKHSSTLTLNAVKAQKNGKKVKTNVVKAVFPGMDSMTAKYPYLEKYPFLLPVAYGARIVKYGKESKSMSGNKASESIKIGNQRIELLKKYDII